jgi:hypothetical protein
MSANIPEFRCHAIAPVSAFVDPTARRAVLGRGLLLQGRGDFRRHVFLVVLGEHLVGDEGAVGAHRAVRDDTLTFAKQIGQHAGVFDRNLVREIGEHESHLQIAGLARDAALDDHAADAKALGGRRLAGRHLARVVIEHDVLARGHDRERHRGGDAAEMPSTTNRRLRRGVTTFHHGHRQRALRALPRRGVIAPRRP